MKRYDIIVIGSGGGLKIAGPAAERGLSVALIENGPMGGTCLNRGCIPSKMLIYPGHIAEIVRDANRFEISGVDKDSVRPDFRAVIEDIEKQTSEISQKLEKNYSEMKTLDLYRTSASFISNDEIEVDGEHLTADKIFIATGSIPSIPPIDGLEGTPYMTSTEALTRRDLPKSMIVLGVGYIALELGYAYAAYGTEVTFIVRSKVLRKMDDDIAEEFTHIFSQRHNLHYAEVESVKHSDGKFTLKCIDNEDNIEELTSDALLVATGTRPATETLGIENTDIELDDSGFIKVNDRLQTTVPGIYALGDVVGNYMFRHTVNYEGEYLVKAVLEDLDVGALDYGPVPYAVFTDPEIAGTGADESELIEEGIDYVVGRADYADSTPGMARRSEHGFAKILLERSSRKILGAHIVGEEASDMIHILTPVIKMGGTLEDLLDMIFIHPALPEVVRDAARNARDIISS